MRVISDSHFFLAFQVCSSSQKGRCTLFAGVILFQQADRYALRVAAAAAGRDSGDFMVIDPKTGTGSGDIAPFVGILHMGADTEIIVDIGVPDLNQSFLIDALTADIMAAPGPVAGMLYGNP